MSPYKYDIYSLYVHELILFIHVKYVWKSFCIQAIRSFHTCDEHNDLSTILIRYCPRFFDQVGHQKIIIILNLQNFEDGKRILQEFLKNSDRKIIIILNLHCKSLVLFARVSWPSLCSLNNLTSLLLRNS